MSGPGRETPIAFAIPLTKGQSALVDECDYERLSKNKWYASWSACTASYYACRTPYVDGKKRHVSMHREALGAAGKMQVDHINHDTLDNRRGNLRLVSAADNRANKRPHKTNKSGVPGVCWDKVNKRWLSNIKKGGRYYNLGRFVEFEDAVAVRECAEHLLFGEHRYDAAADGAR